MGVRATLQSLYSPVGATVNHQLAVSSASGAPATGAATISMAATVPSWVVVNMPVFDVTAGVLLGKVASIATTVVTLAANSLANGALGDILQFGFTPSDLAVGQAAGRDLRGNLEVIELHLSEAIVMLNDMATDAITSGQDATANTTLTAAVTSLS